MTNHGAAYGESKHKSLIVELTDDIMDHLENIVLDIDKETTKVMKKEIGIILNIYIDRLPKVSRDALPLIKENEELRKRLKKQDDKISYAIQHLSAINFDYKMDEAWANGEITQKDMDELEI